jgi:hypothetical protein
MEMSHLLSITILPKYELFVNSQKTFNGSTIFACFVLFHFTQLCHRILRNATVKNYPFVCLSLSIHFAGTFVLIKISSRNFHSLFAHKSAHAEKKLSVLLCKYLIATAANCYSPPMQFLNSPHLCASVCVLYILW